jgi:hypothetical protein
VLTELWTPSGVTGHSVAPVGRNAETGGAIQQHIFRVHDPVTGKKHKFCILVDEDTSQAHLEDMASSAVDRWLTEVRQKDHKPAPTPEQRKEIGRILNDIRTNRMKRAGSSTGRIYYSGLKGGRNGKHRGKG